MTPEISEFSYGFALTNEIVGWIGLKAAPIFPSLIEEGRKGGGYDVKLETPGVPLYLQFKRSDCMTRRSAWEISKYQANLRIPFYRFAITQSEKSDQHMMLLELDDGESEVLYAAPRFHTFSEINQAWSFGEIAARSIFIRPAIIGVLDTKPHHISYDSERAYLCSEPQQIEFMTAPQLSERLFAHLKHETRPLSKALPEYRSSLRRAWARGADRLSRVGDEQLVEIATSKLPFSDQIPESTSGRVTTRTPAPLDETLAELRQLADDALKLFNTQLVIVQAEGGG